MNAQGLHIITVLFGLQPDLPTQSAMNLGCTGWSVEEAEEFIDTRVRSCMPLGIIPIGTMGVVERWDIDPDGAVVLIIRWFDYRATGALCRECFFKQMEILPVKEAIHE